jgi:aryl sulfotransferase
VTVAAFSAAANRKEDFAKFREILDPVRLRYASGMPTLPPGLKPYRNATFDNRRWDGFKPRPGDIFVCTPPKCGTTWTQTIIGSLLFPDGKLPGPVMEVSPWLEFELLPIEAVTAVLEAQTHRRWIKSHTPADGIPWFPTAKYVVVGRDGRDAFMSLVNHVERFKAMDVLNLKASQDGVPPMPAWEGDYHAFFRMYLERDDMVFHHLASFFERRADPRVLLVHYNDLKADLSGEMRRIADFLGISVPAELWGETVDRCTFDRMRERGSKEIGPMLDVAFEGGAQGFIFKGTNGRWKDILTAEELELYRKRVAEVMSPAAARWLEFGKSAL